MRSLLFVLPCAAILPAFLPRVPDDVQALPVERPDSISAAGAALLAGQPVAFVPNEGQWEHPARYVARLGPMTVFVEELGWTFTLEDRDEDAGQTGGVAVRMVFEGAKASELVAEERQPGHHNYFLGSDPSKWRSDVALFRSVRLEGLYPGVDVRLREQDGHLEYDVIVAPGADLGQVVVAVEGTTGLRLGEDGELVIETALGEVVQPLPKTWEEGPAGERRSLACRYVLLGEDRFGFEAPEHEPDRRLVIDPGLVYSTFFGGTGYDEPLAMVLDASGGAVVVGDTTSSDFPTTPGAYDLTYSCCSPGFVDAFVTRFDASGSSLVYSTFLGGTSNDWAHAVAVDPSGAATVTGKTSSSAPRWAAL